MKKSVTSLSPYKHHYVTQTSCLHEWEDDEESANNQSHWLDNPDAEKSDIKRKGNSMKMCINDEWRRTVWEIIFLDKDDWQRRCLKGINRLLSWQTGCVCRFEFCTSWVGNHFYIDFILFNYNSGMLDNCTSFDVFFHDEDRPYIRENVDPVSVFEEVQAG